MASRLASPGSWFRSIGNRIVQGVKSYFGIKSPSKVFAGLGGNLIQGFIKGMISSGANIPKVINRVFGSMPKALGALVDKGKISFGDLSGKAMNTLFDMGAAIGPGGFGFPLARGSFRVGSPFGMRNGKMHTGQDFPASIGTPVFSPISGYFNPVDLGNRSYGKYANVMAGAWRFIGAHLSAFARGPGGVRIGELLGFVGSTGNSTGPHLHAEMRYNGRAMDPRKIWSYAKGGMARAGQFAWAGEHGRELLYFARDARVFNAQESEQLVAGAAGGKTVNQYITVNTQEINPRKHAADLGWELATRT
jgi:hypothetical protein